MSVANVFGSIVTGAAVERAIVDFLTGPDEQTGGTWLSTYLGEIERVEGLEPNSVQRPLGVVTASQFEKWSEDQLPVLVVMNAGLAGKPVRQGDSTLTLTWAIGVGAYVSDVDEVASRLMAQVYGAAISLAISQHRSLGGFANDTVFMDERYDDLDFGDGRTLGVARCVFAVSVANARSTRGGPAAPLPDPPPDDPSGGPGADPGPWPAPTSVTVAVTPVPITEDVH